MTLPKWASTVTPLSKTIAIIIFISFPILGFILGMKYQQIYLIPKNDIAATLPTPLASQNSAIDLANTIPLTFGTGKNERIVRLEQKNISYNTDNFISLSSKEFDSKTKKITQFYENNGDWGNFKFHDLNTDKYYVLQPGGQIEMSLLTSNEIEKILGGSLQVDSSAGTTTQVSCAKKEMAIGNIKAVGIACQSTSYLTENHHIVNEDETTNCYLPLSSDSYLAIEQTLKPVSTNIDMCKTLDSLGYINVSVAK